MKKLFKTFLALALSLSLIASCSLMAFAVETDQDVAVTSVPKADGYNVMLNGEYVAFTDAQPANVQGRIMVPFRAILETLGAKVEWDGATKTISAATDDTAITFIVGKPDIKIVKDGNETTKTMDVVPYIDAKTGRTFVGTRFMAESFGFSVGWDSAEKTAVIIDYDKLFGDVDKDYTIMNKLMKESALKPGVTYESAVDAALSATIYKQALELITGVKADKEVKFDIEIEASEISKDADMSLEAGIKTNLTDVIKALQGSADPAQQVSEAELAILEKVFTDLQLSICADMKTGDCFFKTNVNSMIDPKADENTWFQVNIYDYYKALGMDIETILNSALMGETTSMSDLMDAIADSSEPTMTIYTYDQMKSVIDSMKAIMGDEAFKVTKSGSKTVYTSDLGKMFNIPGVEGLLSGSGKMVITEEKGAYSSDLNMEITVTDLMKLSFSMSSPASKETTKPVAKVPADAKIIKLDVPKLI